MPLKVVVELQIHAVTCPGVYLTEKNDVYLTVCILGQSKETESLPSIFPLLFHEKMWFEKVFEKAKDPIAVVELLGRNVTKFRLSELIPTEREGLAFYEVNTRDFLFPEPKLTPVYPGVDRELLMKTHPTFPGIAPKLEFSTRTTITELPLRSRRWYHDRGKIKLQRPTSASPQRRSISPIRCRPTRRNSICKRFTRSLGSRSPSPSPAKHFHEFGRDNQKQLSPLSFRSVKFKTEPDLRPPFVVRHVDPSKSFAEQTPSLVPYRNVRQNVSPGRNSHKSQLKRALSFDSWKASCPAAKVIREPDACSSSNHVSSFLEIEQPLDYSCSDSTFDHKSSVGSPNCYRSLSPSERWESSHQRLYSSPSASWEEINERVRNLLTSEEAKQRLFLGATDSEIDDVLERRSISLRSSPLCDSLGQRYCS
ncbi:spermatogenesis associated 6-like protein isoform X1 [Sphaerodactylus townsendi]|uniref:spermatogenesis associated 6-like protein isoform X1 n=1 Tax=Sphaerodactylus townsendi TaxID=933632 RepID=UPI002025E4C5|nr:spermatogenesis associated 6-like protein isoform X1 [Sphaerodactylus townsendi]